jgi:hypothetical protein
MVSIAWRVEHDAVDLLVGPKFYLLSIDEKQLATQAAWNKTFEGRQEWGVLFLKDSWARCSSRTLWNISLRWRRPYGNGKKVRAVSSSASPETTFFLP